MNSQNEALIFACFGFLIGILWVGFVISAKWIWQYLKFEYEYMKHPRLVPHVEELICKDVHAWSAVTLALRGLEAGEYRVCQKCGCISGNSSVMLSNEALAQVNQGLALLQQRKQLEQLVQERIATLTDIYVTQFISREFVSESRDATFVTKLNQFADFVLEAQVTAAEKVASELEAQKDLDARYAGWPDKIKGNA